MAIRIKLSEMPTQMRMFEFPCSESNCYVLAEGELTIRFGNTEYKLPICPAHIVEFSMELDESESFSRL